MKAINKHIIYSVEDIHQYLTGKLSPAEMHAIEKAALTDPLLAEAIEGFHATASFKNEKEFAHLQKELDQLKKKIGNRHTGFNSWWKMAAILTFCIGSFITYRALTHAPIKEGQNIVAVIQPIKKTLSIKNTIASTVPLKTTNDVAAVSHAKIHRPILMAAVMPSIQQTVMDKAATNVLDSQMVFTKAEKGKSPSPGIMSTENSFSGIIIDKDSNAIPYATLLVNGQQSRTDKEGYFEMKTTNSVIQLEVEARGYYPKNIDIQPGDHKTILLDKIFLKKDTSADGRLRSIVTILYKNGVEPNEGWEKYVQYMVDQLSYSSYDNGKQVTGEMILNFKIDINSMPTDFLFEQSIDNDVNNAVKQLIENGPSWRKTKGLATPGVVRLRIVF
jgi:hypothetical protein